MHHSCLKIEIFQVGQGIVEKTGQLLEEWVIGLLDQDLKIGGTVINNENG